MGSIARAIQRRKDREQRKAKKTFNMTRQEMMLSRKRDIDLGTNQALVLMLAIPLKVMHDKYGWRARKRLPEFCDAISDEYQKIVDGDYKDFDEYADFVERVTGGRFVREV